MCSNYTVIRMMNLEFEERLTWPVLGYYSRAFWYEMNIPLRLSGF
jgi:hypothetical protein